MPGVHWTYCTSSLTKKTMYWLQVNSANSIEFAGSRRIRRTHFYSRNISFFIGVLKIFIEFETLERTDEEVVKATKIICPIILFVIKDLNLDSIQ